MRNREPCLNTDDKSRSYKAAARFVSHGFSATSKNKDFAVESIKKKKSHFDTWNYVEYFYSFRFLLLLSA